ncbi:MAG TPA: TIGR02678 family protein [Paenibacillaceae bacterium]|nr:TIGR02678 family protein [Paenibacillaceae bacterium]
MLVEKKAYPFDEVAKEAASYLLEYFWILREKEPDMYRQVCERENDLRGYFLDKCGFRLFVHRDFVKLEKIPAQPTAWMGIEAFEASTDYVMFCCVMAFLETKTVDDQFLLGELCEGILALYPLEEGEELLNWNSYSLRRGLVRVLKFAEEVGVLKVVDGQSEGFGQNEDHEVLYEVPVVARYFLRAYPKDITEFTRIEELLEAGQMGDGQATASRRHRVYRQLLLTPAYYAHESWDEDFIYLRNMRNRLKVDLESHTYFNFELYKHAGMLTVTEKKSYMAFFPDQRGISDILLHWMGTIREEVAREKLACAADGRILLTESDFLRLVRRCKEETGRGWIKAYRDVGEGTLLRDMKKELIGWKMLEEDKENGVYYLNQGAGRLIGQYPCDYIERREGHGNHQQVENESDRTL